MKVSIFSSMNCTHSLNNSNDKSAVNRLYKDVDATNNCMLSEAEVELRLKEVILKKYLVPRSSSQHAHKHGLFKMSNTNTTDILSLPFFDKFFSFE